MIAAPVPPDEPKRLAALLRLKLLNSTPDQCFEAITRAVATALNVPVALISLVDAERQWFMCRVGLDARETPRAVSFCGYAILEAEPMIVPDALQDPRFANNPLVLGPPHVRAYLGAPLVTGDNDALGTLCAIDHKPKAWTPSEVSIVSDLARVAVALIQARAEKLELAALIERALAVRASAA